MVQVDKKILKIFTLIMLSFFLSACSLKKVTINEDRYKKRSLYGISKDAILEAAKKAFVFTANDQFRIDSYRNSLYVRRTKVEHSFWGANSFDDIWNLSVIEKNNTSYLSLDIKRVHQFDEKNFETFDEDLYNLFWVRLDYFLGLNKTWHECEFYYVFYDALCDGVDFNVKNPPNVKDVVKDIKIKDKKQTLSVLESSSDILKDDIILNIEETNTDILKQEDKGSLDNIDDLEDSKLDKVIDELDKKVTQSIEETLNEIKKEE